LRWLAVRAPWIGSGSPSLSRSPAMPSFVCTRKPSSPTPSRGAPRWRISSEGSRSSSSTISCSGQTTRGVSVLLGDRGRVRRVRDTPGEPRRDAMGGVAGAAREAAGVQAADGVDIPVGVRARQRLQLRLQRLGDRGAAARGKCRIQLPARRPSDRRDTGSGARRPVRGHVRNRRGHVRATGRA
jgi:hypothetical protein